MVEKKKQWWHWFCPCLAPLWHCQCRNCRSKPSFVLSGAMRIRPQRELALKNSFSGGARLLQRKRVVSAPTQMLPVMARYHWCGPHVHASTLAHMHRQMQMHMHARLHACTHPSGTLCIATKVTSRVTLLPLKRCIVGTHLQTQASPFLPSYRHPPTRSPTARNPPSRPQPFHPVSPHTLPLQQQPLPSPSSPACWFKKS